MMRVFFSVFLASLLIFFPDPLLCLAPYYNGSIAPGFRGSQISYIYNDGIFLESNSSAFGFLQFAEAQGFAFKEEEEEESMQDTDPFLQMLQSEEDPLPFTSFKELLSLQNLHKHRELESYLSHNETNQFYHNPVSASSMEGTRQALSSQELPLS